MDVGAATHTGFVRERNEDALLVEEERGLFVVADGLGGHAAGDVASKIAIEEIARRLHNGALDNGTSAPEVLRDSLHSANRAVDEDAASHPERVGMGTTAVIVHVSPERHVARIAHVGDSRAYLVRDDTLHQVTDDHTSGGLRSRGAITQAIGTGPIQPDVVTVELEEGDRLILCTDGLTDMLQDDMIARIAADGGGSAQDVCDALVETALQRGGVDNVTVIVVDVDD